MKEDKDVDSPVKVDIEGWYPNPKKTPNLDVAELDENYVFSCRRHVAGDLVILDLERVVGSVWKPLYVIGVVSLGGTLTPFFVKKSKIERLRKIIKDARDPSIRTL